MKLFPTEEKEILYYPYSKTTDGQVISARGSLFSTYRTLRKLFRSAQMLERDVEGEESLDESNNSKKMFDFNKKEILHT